MAPGGSSGTVSGENSAIGPNDPVVECETGIATADYFKALGIAVLDGRTFAESDAEGALPVAIVDENFPGRFYPNEGAIGKRIKRGRLDAQIHGSQWLVCSDTCVTGGSTLIRSSQVYMSFYQQPGNFNISLAVRANIAEPGALIGSVRPAIQGVDRNQPVFEVRTMREIVADSIAPRRLVMQLLGFFAVVALILSAIGIYGVMAYVVSQRTHEWGIRLALGAPGPHVLRLILAQGMKIALMGVGIGLVCAWPLTRLMSTVLCNVSATDAATFSVFAVILLGVAILACYVPARRATKVDPVIALRHE